MQLLLPVEWIFLSVKVRAGRRPHTHYRRRNASSQHDSFSASSRSTTLSPTSFTFPVTIFHPTTMMNCEPQPWIPRAKSHAFTPPEQTTYSQSGLRSVKFTVPGHLLFEGWAKQPIPSNQEHFMQSDPPNAAKAASFNQQRFRQKRKCSNTTVVNVCKS